MELEGLEMLLELCFFLDHGEPKILDDFVHGTASTHEGRSMLLRSELQAFACVALEVLLHGDGVGVKTENESLDARVQRFRTRVSQKGSNSSRSKMVDSMRALLAKDVFPYSAVQILDNEDQVFKMPDWIHPLHSFVCKLQTKSGAV